MRKKIDICDNCEKQTFDRYEQIDWINIKFNDIVGTINISISKGSDVLSGNTKTNFKQLQGLDFCCFDCFIDYFKKLLENY